MTKEYLELTSLIERMHRRYLDVIRTELNRMKIRDINSVQAMLLANIGQEEIVIRDLIERGYTKARTSPTTSRSWPSSVTWNRSAPPTTSARLASR